MKTLALLAAFVALAPVTADTIAFGPETGSTVEKTFEMSIMLDQRSISMKVGEHELPSELTENTEMSWKSKQKLVVEDEYREVGSERPVKLARKFADMSDKSEQRIRMVGMEETQEISKDKESPLEGKTVLFSWNEKDEEYAKEWVGDGADDDLLADLKEEFDFKLLVPSKSVSEGDTWKIDLADFDNVLGPCGELAFKGDDDEEDDDDDGEFQENLTGEVVLTYGGTKEEGKRKLAVLTAVLKGKTFQEQEQGEGSTMRMDYDLDLEGEFLWDVGAKRLASYKLSGDVTCDMDIKQAVDMGGETGELVIALELAGTVEIECAFKQQ